ncbi:metal-dependent transcriptional regulator [Kocuria atrinae]|uniref:metal-dependent transcriptional regulator n=1 Tax=Kocuria atrinae TaxID=592377 RepID=UPI0002DCCD9B|nr:metal-dependent transcriptional regulator [Kocuria atrinae]
MQPAELSSSTQDYLKTIWQLGEWSPDKVTTTTLAARMGLAASTVSEALKKLTAQGMVTRPSYGVVELTDEGRSVAVTMVRRHRLLETFLTTKLGYAWDEVHDEAEVLEHAVSEKFLDRIDALLGHPSADPHGDVIPSPSGVIAAPTAVQLVDVLKSVAVDVVRVSDDDPATCAIWPVLGWCRVLGCGCCPIRGHRGWLRCRWLGLRPLLLPRARMAVLRGAGTVLVMFPLLRPPLPIRSPWSAWAFSLLKRCG